MLGQREEYLEAGMDDYVTKPIERPLLFAAIARVLSYTAKTAVAGSSAGDANHPAPAGAGAPDGPHSGAADLSDDAAKTSKRSWTKRGPVSKWSRKSDRMLEQRK